jgi:hypothetical protein
MSKSLKMGIPSAVGNLDIRGIWHAMSQVSLVHSQHNNEKRSLEFTVHSL